MSEYPNNQREREWADETQDGAEYQPEPYEETYRDGRAKNECWDSDR